MASSQVGQIAARKPVFVKVEWFGSPGKPYGESGEDFHTEAMMDVIAASP
jgi:hypothetical protein